MRDTESDPESALMATLSTNASEAQSYYSSKYEELIKFAQRCKIHWTVQQDLISNHAITTTEFSQPNYEDGIHKKN